MDGAIEFKYPSRWVGEVHRWQIEAHGGIFGVGADRGMMALSRILEAYMPYNTITRAVL